MTDAMLGDILAQPSLQAAALERHLTPESALDRAVQGIHEMHPRRIIFTGMGSSLFAAYPAYLHLLQHGVAAIWVELSELFHYTSGQIGSDTLLIVVSQSGETIEAVRLIQERKPAALLTITNTSDSTLARAARWVIDTGAGPEASVATKTYATALLALTILAERITGTSPRELAASMKPAIQAAQQVADHIEEQIAVLPAIWHMPGPITLVGRGPALATALSGGLLLKETAKVPSEAMSSAQFRHGPIEISGTGHRMIICAAPGHTLGFEQKLALELQQHGSAVLWVGPAFASPQNGSDMGVFTNLSVPASSYLGFYAQIPLQMLARAQALTQGIAPGAFRYIGKVTTEE
jgi:glutamine---fructose-6-phosphate transaminase (isomerizing)